MLDSPPISARSAKNGILHFLKQTGPADARTIARHFAVSGMAVRQHLYALRDAGLVDYREQRQPLGRPAKLWRLTERAQKIFPDAHAELTVSLLQSLTEIFGAAGVNKMIALRAAKQVEAYRGEIPKGVSLTSRLAVLSSIREREGYMARIEKQKNGSFLFIENHCPICAAAAACTGLCSAELEVFQKVLGKDCRIERTEHLLSGARRCAYQITEAVPRRR